MAELVPQDNGAPARQSAEYVHRRVREAILESELPPGETMSQVALAEELGVSRTPLREALRMLQGEGLIEARPNRRVRVAPISAAEMAHFAEQRDMRRWLVPHAEYHRQLTNLAGERFAVLLSQLFDHAERYRR